MRTLQRALFATILAGSALAFTPAASAAGVPQTITHQGRLYDASDKPINSTLSVQFALYADASATTAIWTETDSVTFDDGYFSVSIGETTPFTAGLFDGTVLYLGITVGSDPEMSPRVKVQSVPYAMVAGDAIGDIHPTTVAINGVGTVINSGGKWVGDPAGLQGPQGPQGPQGLQGPQGPAGAAGPAGPTGPAGAAGPAGATGAAGPQGTAGAAGPAGVQGPQGTTGNTGAVGPTGPAGATGGIGPQGLQGLQGAVGPQGVQGVQGPAGGAGPAGVAGPAGATGAVGLTGPAGPMVMAQGLATVPIPTSTGGTTYNQLGPAVFINTTATQNVSVTSTISLGSSLTGGATALSLTICDFTAGVVLGSTLTGIRVPQNVTIPMTVNMVIAAPGAGTHQYALCGGTTSANWNVQGGVYTTAIAY
jgi:hypothetical protein